MYLENTYIQYVFILYVGTYVCVTKTRDTRTLKEKHMLRWWLQWSGGVVGGCNVGGSGVGSGFLLMGVLLVMLLEVLLAVAV